MDIGLMAVVATVLFVFAVSRSEYSGIAEVATAITPIVLGILAIIQLKLNYRQKINTRETQKVLKAVSAEQDIKERDQREGAE